VEIYTIGFTRTSAEHFFGRLKTAGVKRLLDVRLNNSSQLAGFAKARDLPYFLDMLGLARAFLKDGDDRERHWLQVNGICMADRPLSDRP
jgi:uncharacterized protein (DUF488 family)